MQMAKKSRGGADKGVLEARNGSFQWKYYSSIALVCLFRNSALYLSIVKDVFRDLCSMISVDHLSHLTHIDHSKRRSL